MRYKLQIAMDVINPSILQPGEKFEYITNDHVPGVYPYYMISNYGRVYHRYLEIIMRPGLETSGYLFIVLSTCNGPKIVQLNRLVLKVFKPIENDYLYQANHLNGNKFENTEWNLEWATRSENILHAYRTGLHIPITTISEEQAKEVVEMLKSGKYMCKEIARILGINENIVNSIKKKESWKHLTLDCSFEHREGRKYSDEQIATLCKYFQTNPKPENMEIKTYVEIAAKDCGFEDPKSCVDTLRKVYTRTHYTRISKNYKF